MTPAIDLYPAIDVRGGRVVRLTQGRYDDETVYGDDPLTIAREFIDAGATWIHVVDLDAAKSGVGTNRDVIEGISRVAAGVARVQVGGGVRSVADARELAHRGVSRVVMGSAAMSTPQLVAEVAQLVPVAVGLDHRGGEVSVDGWTRSGGRRIEECVTLFPDAAAFVVTDISRDGMLMGPDVDGLVALAEATSTPVIASGGVASIDNLVALRATGVIAGVITGKAIYEGRFTVGEALAALK
ncbi:MAG: 1-(5-phosphoribosyl)-5-[(5-phosphoribosylamino) methylideneamino] imidazole-4-carboxamide isomerase [Actinomycetota bacterium]|jgi:phosphoribosylformimino-5-aminoimidazole carboxamide ribotide isomerase